jgi:signal transduction histidine kinase
MSKNAASPGTGPALDKELEALFERFARIVDIAGDVTTTELRLPISDALAASVERMGGKRRVTAYRRKALLDARETETYTIETVELELWWGSEGVRPRLRVHAQASDRPCTPEELTALDGDQARERPMEPFRTAVVKEAS